MPEGVWEHTSSFSAFLRVYTKCPLPLMWVPLPE